MASSRLRYCLVLSVLVALLTMALKYAAYCLTGSVGLLSDAAESIINVLASATALFSLEYASLPVDPEHTYGHEKIEYFSSGLEGILIVVAALGIAWVALRRLLAPQPLESFDKGLAITALAAALNLGTARLLLRLGRSHGSIVVEAHGKHLMTDVWTSAAVIAGVGVVGLTRIDILDPLIALVVAGHIVRTGIELVRRAFEDLMDHALAPEEQERVRAVIEAHLEPDMDFHALRTRRAGAHRFADFHLLVPGAFTVRKAHDLSSRIEDAVQAALPGIEVTVHIEPIEEQAAWNDSALVPLERAARQAQAEKTNSPNNEPATDLPT